MDTWIQGYRDTGIQGYRNTGIQGYRDTRIKGYRDTGIQGYRDPGLQGYKDTGILEIYYVLITLCSLSICNLVVIKYKRLNILILIRNCNYK